MKKLTYAFLIIISFSTLMLLWLFAQTDRIITGPQVEEKKHNTAHSREEEETSTPTSFVTYSVHNTLQTSTSLSITEKTRSPHLFHDKDSYGKFLDRWKFIRLSRDEKAIQQLCQDAVNLKRFRVVFGIPTAARNNSASSFLHHSLELLFNSSDIGVDFGVHIFLADLNATLRHHVKEQLVRTFTTQYLEGRIKIFELSPEGQYWIDPDAL